MTERTSQSLVERDYVPAMGRDVLLPLYDVVHHVAGAQRVHEEMLRQADLRPGHRVLDVGAGTGNLLRTAGRRHRGIELVGLDPDPKALARARRKARRAGLTVRFDRGFAQALPYPDGSFDRVLSSLMLHHLDTADKDALLAEVHRVLRPGGLLVLADFAVDGHAHNRGHGRMSGRLQDNVGDAVPRRIAAAGFDVAAPVTVTLRFGGAVAIHPARRR